jgi:ATP-binding cassette subfamily B protein
MDSPRPSQRLLREALWPGRRGATALGAALGAATVLPLLGPQITREIVDGAVEGRETSTLVAFALLYLGLAIAGQAATVLTAWLASRHAWDGTNRLRERLAEHALRLDLAFHARRTPGEMIERVDGDVVALSNFVVVFLLDIVGSALLLVGTLVLVTVAEPIIGLALIAYAVVITFLLLRLQRMAVPTAAAYRESSAQLFGNLEERLAGAEDIRANGAGAHVVRRFHETAANLYRADQRAENVGGAIFVATGLAFTGATALVLALAIVLQRQDAISLGTAVLIFQYTLMVRRPLERIVDQIQQYQKALAGTARIAELLEVRSSLPEPADGGRPLPAYGPLAVAFDGASFAYEDDNEVVLHDFDLRVAAGRSLGLVGRTGSGKTTVARLLLRLYDPTSGSVRVGGVDLRDVAPSDLRQRVAIVTQDVQLFSSTVRDNLRLFRDMSNDERLVEILEEVGLGPWLRRLPDGLDTELGAGGVGVSAGEAQLLALARAFLADPGLVVLDEASSRLDPATETIIERAIDRLLADRTAIVIAHRLSSLSRMDEIAVIDHGHLVEHGERSDLAADRYSRFAGLLASAGVAGRP